MSGTANKDLYSTFVTSGPGSFIASRVGLPQPPNLRRYSPTQAPLAGPVVLGGEGRLVEPLREILAAADGYDLISNNTGAVVPTSSVPPCSTPLGSPRRPSCRPCSSSSRR